MAEKPVQWKRRRRRMETPYQRITELKEAGTAEEANTLLNSGFVLIKAVDKRSVDLQGRQDSCVLYILGKMKGRSATQAQPQPPNGHDAKPQPDEPEVDLAMLETRPWRKYDNGSGEWTFITDQDGAMLPELEPAREFLERLKSGEDLVVGNYRYRAKDKFLKRYPVNGQRE